MRNRTLLSITFLAILVLITSCDQKTGATNGNTENPAAKSFTLESLGGNEEIGLENFKGKPIVINFWATWCGPCKQEIPFFEKTWKEYKDKGVVFIGIDVMDDKENAVEFIETLGISYTNLYDPSGKTSNAYGVVALPATFFIDKNGNIAVKHYGSFLGSDAEKAFKSYLEDII
ncbi:MAG: TlpA family protein disulfide reductase [Thermodesulfobacteriales bacterium]|nr:MAG: TlpA family protein disulfide reductase [Thermodesulfobacteriales bacterium]